ncbi:MAG: nucleotidyltransferase domain-containing protein [Alicyclobacillus sp.]|nr:nucleotidyltransferase domain-containing protein [Alicyclobacillus sp.]
MNVTTDGPRLSGLRAAEKFVSAHYPDCNIAFLAGSTARGDASPYSDLDILVICDHAPSPYIEAFFEYGWMIEVLMHNRNSYKHFFEMDRNRARPSLPEMFATGIVLVDDGTAAAIQLEAQQLLEAGPPALSPQEMQFLRFAITNHLLDLQGGLQPLDAIFVVNELADRIHELVLRTNGKWIGKGKRLVRALEDYNPDFAVEFAETFGSFYTTHDVAPVIDFADRVLDCYGGRLFEGYSTRQE